MEMRLSLTDADDSLADKVGKKQKTSKRAAVLQVFRRHGKQYTKEEVESFKEAETRGRKSKSK